MHWIDKFRIFPRIILIGWAVSTGLAFDWYISFEEQVQTSCDSHTMKVLLDRNMPVDEATQIACTPVAVIGRPAGYTALIATLVGSGSAIFGFYVNSGSGAARRREDLNDVGG